ncbi:MAG: cytolethal distending toxin subunit B family protein [Acinetobacter sp.]
MKKLLLLMAIIFSISPMAYSALEDFRVATWNLQGSSASTESKWNVNVRRLVTGAGAADILMIQEAGSVPSSAILTDREFSTPGIPMNEYIWHVGTNSRPETLYIYFSRVDALANRVNLAIVTNRRADQIIVLPPPTVVSRPIIGMRLGNDVFFTAHATANGGRDAPALVNSVFEFFDRQTDPVLQAANWMIAGDFNRLPSNLLSALDERVQTRTNFLSPDDPTQVSGGVLDYAITGNVVGAVTTALQATLMFGLFPGHASDHFPVFFARTF